MAEYIERLEAVKAFAKACHDGDIVSFEDTTSFLMGLPAADVAPVRHSHWEVAIGYDPNKAFQCQNCFRMAYENTEYCPNCGARMDGEEDAHG